MQGLYTDWQTTIKIKGTCFTQSSWHMKAFMVSNCLKGCFTSLKVPSMYHVEARPRVSNCSSVGKIRCLLVLVCMSAHRKVSGKASSSSSDSMLVKSFGLLLWQNRLAVLARYSGLLRAGQGAVVDTSSSNTCCKRKNNRIQLSKQYLL